MTNSVLPTEFRLQPNYPNPFNPETTINYTLPQPAEVQLTIYNMQWHEVRRLIQTTKSAGYFSVRWDARDNLGTVATSGIYFYRIEIKSQANGFSFVDVKKMILMKKTKNSNLLNLWGAECN